MRKPLDNAGYRIAIRYPAHS